MVLLKQNDLYHVNLVTLIAEYDRDTLMNLYQPLIGYTAVALYLTLWSEANLQIKGNKSHDSLYSKMGIAPGDFIKARKALEAVGLMKSKLIKRNLDQKFNYFLYAPKTPNDFFNDTILYGLLIKCLGEDEAENIKSLYSINKDERDEGENISASFGEVFHPNFEDSAFLKAIYSDKAQGRNHAKIMSSFSIEKLFEEIAKISQINEKGFSKKEINEVSRLATLYGVDEVVVASIIADNYDPQIEKGKRIDFAILNRELQNQTNYSYLSNKKSNYKGPKTISSKSPLASKINLFENVSPKDVLSLLQDGTKPATSDLYLINDISKNYHLPNSVINVLIDYVLTNNNNVLGRSYTEKVAASLVREGVTTASDAMDYLNKISSKQPVITKYENNDNISTKVENKEEKVNWEDLINQLEVEEEDGEI